ncbi:hypothetical protein [Dankookia sp. P2]|uniref:hypothetical protein n=1 Tax=Dankookia sp. P2 TaxID=3423955 RepID=UPI003D663EB7
MSSKLSDQRPRIDHIVMVAGRRGQQPGLEILPPRRVPQQVPTLLGRPEDAIVAQVDDGAGWAIHAVGAFLLRSRIAGL